MRHLLIRHSIVPALVFALSLTVSTSSCPRLEDLIFTDTEIKTFPELGRVTRIEVVGKNTDDKIRTVTEANEIAEIVAFVDSHRAGWGGKSDRFGVPIPRVAAEFYDGSTFKGHFGVGRGFFETHREGDFASKRISEQEQQKFLTLLDLSDERLTER